MSSKYTEMQQFSLYNCNWKKRGGSVGKFSNRNRVTSVTNYNSMQRVWTKRSRHLNSVLFSSEFSSFLADSRAKILKSENLKIKRNNYGYYLHISHNIFFSLPWDKRPSGASCRTPKQQFYEATSEHVNQAQVHEQATNIVMCQSTCA